jgi:hypothetical protein
VISVRECGIGGGDRKQEAAGEKAAGLIKQEKLVKKNNSSGSRVLIDPGKDQPS